MSSRTIISLLTITILITLISSTLYLQPQYTSKLTSLHLSTTRSQLIKFEERRQFFDLSRQGDKDWDSILPPDGGFISVPSRSSEGGYEMAGITMFHQLHCLAMLRGTIQSLMGESDGMVNGQDLRASGGSRHSHMNAHRTTGPHRDDFGVRKRSAASMHEAHAHGEEHWVHCLDYLMQGILCAADDTVEYARTDEEGKRTVDGYGVEHQCRSADAIWSKVMGASSIPGWRGTDLKS